MRRHETIRWFILSYSFHGIVLRSRANRSRFAWFAQHPDTLISALACSSPKIAYQNLSILKPNFGICLLRFRRRSPWTISLNDSLTKCASTIYDLNQLSDDERADKISLNMMRDWYPASQNGNLSPKAAYSFA